MGFAETNLNLRFFINNILTNNVGPIGLAVLTFNGFNQTDGQTLKQTNILYIYIDFELVNRGVNDKVYL